ncbi:hypothetical protein SISSUDRAFT_1029513 [Sistotremastrum suecicum HHB10207 ss-3]|uniref:F-box domain-containing protein n=1 Tax=Sistotremastrum suecicum HHB10207 ss-3 TaxID=1314776 RepID=A0A166IH82_9AGAM|nr:hypothetical protein SISSUDRAFT_1029513 [Sistotremastrum suecicum HHB10207 ss-3]
MSTIRFNNLPSDILFELFGYLELQDIFAVEQVSRHLRTLIRSSRAIWLSVTATLGKELPLPYPPLRPHSSLQTLELRDVALRSLILDRSWRSKVTKPARQPRLLEFPETKNEKVSMLRLLPGAKQVLTVTNNGGLACWDVRTGILLSQWHHGGVKLESLDVDVCHADQGLHFMLAVSIEHHYQIENQIYPTHRLYAVRIEILDDTDVPGEGARFVPVAETCWQMPFYIVSIEGDIVAAYSCELDQQPIPQPLATFIVCIMNWQNKTAAMVQIPVEVIGVSISGGYWLGRSPSTLSSSGAGLQCKSLIKELFSMKNAAIFQHLIPAHRYTHWR